MQDIQEQPGYFTVDYLLRLLILLHAIIMQIVLSKLRKEIDAFAERESGQVLDRGQVELEQLCANVEEDGGVQMAPLIESDSLPNKNG